MGIKLDYLEEQKSGIYRFRRKLPLDVRDVFGKKEHKQSLRTKDETLALERWKIVDTEIKQLIQQARNGKFVRSKLTDKANRTKTHRLGATGTTGKKCHERSFKVSEGCVCI